MFNKFARTLKKGGLVIKDVSIDYDVLIRPKPKILSTCFKFSGKSVAEVCSNVKFSSFETVEGRYFYGQRVIS